ncbi:MAG: hypothetical protein V4700_02040 [Pseudomonadota bacterium]
MPGSEYTGSISKKIISTYQKKIIAFPVNNKINLEGSVKKTNINPMDGVSKGQIISIQRGGKPLKLSSKKFNPLPDNKLQSCLVLKKENLIFLMALEKVNFKYKFSQRFLDLRGVKVVYSIKVVPWASNSPRF